MSQEKTRRRRRRSAPSTTSSGRCAASPPGGCRAPKRPFGVAAGIQDIVMQSLAAVLAGPPAGPPAAPEKRPATILVMTAEQPLCGPFNQNVLALAERRFRDLKQAGPVQLLVVGRRGMRHLAARGIAADGAEPAATSVQGLRELVKRLARLLGRQQAYAGGDTVHVIYNRYQSVTEQIPTEERILPLDLELIPGVVAGAVRPPLPVSAPPALLAGSVTRVRVHHALSHRRRLVRRRAGGASGGDGCGHPQCGKDARHPARPGTPRAPAGGDHPAGVGADRRPDCRRRWR